MKAFQKFLCGVLFFALFQTNSLFCQQALPPSLETTVSLPKVFLLGEETSEYEKIVPQYKSLLEACSNDMETAFKKWLSMLLEMETYAGNIDFDLKGVKLWVQVFWNKNGSVDHIGFYLKPTSKNVDVEDIRAFFTSFMNHFSLPLTADFKYAHYTSVSFPTYYKQITEVDKRTGEIPKNNSADKVSSRND